MHKMGVTRGDKIIYLSYCSFCKKVVITDRQECSLHLEEQKNCTKFNKVENMTERLNELFKKLPDDYGRCDDLP